MSSGRTGGKARQINFHNCNSCTHARAVGVGRFRNRTYNEFLQSWNSARRLKEKIGPLEVRASAEHACVCLQYVDKNEMQLCVQLRIGVHVHVCYTCM